MIFRAAPLAIFLVWMAYEAHFSPTFFVSTVQMSLASIASGIGGALGIETPPQLQTALINADGS